MKLENNGTLNHYNLSVEKRNKYNYSRVNLCKEDTVSFSGKVPKTALDRVKLKAQQVLFNLAEKITMPLNHKTADFFNKLERETVYDAISQIEKYCSKNGASVISKVKLFSKKENKYIEGHLIARKIDINTDYKKIKTGNILGDVINDNVHNRISRCKKKKDSFSIRFFGGPKGHHSATENSYLLEVLDDKGLPIGFQFFDINKEFVESKASINYLKNKWGGVGSILSEARSLTAPLTGSNKVITPSTDAAKGFHKKLGFVSDNSKMETGMGEWLYMPKKNLDKIVEKHKDSELYANLEKFLNENK